MQGFHWMQLIVEGGDLSVSYISLKDVTREQSSRAVLSACGFVELYCSVVVFLQQ